MARVKKVVKKAQRGESMGWLKNCNWANRERNPIRLPEINWDFLKRKEKPERPKKPKNPETPETPKPAPIPKPIIPPMEMKLKKTVPVYDYEPGRYVDEKKPGTSSVKPGAKKVPPRSSTSSSTASGSKKPSGGSSRTIPYKSSSKTPSTSTRTRIPGRGEIYKGEVEYTGKYPGRVNYEPGMKLVEKDKQRRGGKVAKKSAPKVARRGAKVVKKAASKACWGKSMKRK